MSDMFEKLKNNWNHWLVLSIALCIFGFFKEVRPSEPFIYEFLIGPWRNLTEEQVIQQVYPVGTYSYLAQLFIVFLITDLCRYKPLIILLGATGIIVWSMLIWTSSLRDLQILEFFYGTFMATEVAYYTYIYAKVGKEHYLQVTSHTRAAILIGRAFSGVLGQILISFKLMNYKELNYISLGALIFATVWSLILPATEKSIYFHQSDDPKNISFHQKCKDAFKLMWIHLKHAYSNKRILKWSFWWALSTCGFIQVQTYMQTLWADIGIRYSDHDDHRKVYNGAVEATLTLFGVLGALFAGCLTIDWKTKGELAITFVSLLQGFAMLITSQTHSVMVSYICYIAFGALYHFMITVGSSEIAQFIKEDSYGLVFGINTFVALAFQSVLTVVVVTAKLGFTLSVGNQYFVYGMYHVILGVVYIVIGLTGWFASKKDYRRTSVAVNRITNPIARL